MPLQLRSKPQKEASVEDAPGQSLSWEGELPKSDTFATLWGLVEILHAVVRRCDGLRCTDIPPQLSYCLGGIHGRRDGYDHALIHRSVTSVGGAVNRHEHVGLPEIGRGTNAYLHIIFKSF
jgi:hypothetical protein